MMGERITYPAGSYGTVAVFNPKAVVAGSDLTVAEVCPPARNDLLVDTVLATALQGRDCTRFCPPPGSACQPLLNDVLDVETSSVPAENPTAGAICCCPGSKISGEEANWMGKLRLDSALRDCRSSAAPNSVITSNCALSASMPSGRT